MRHNFFAGLLFAALMFSIPLFALGRGPKTVQLLPAKDVNAQSEPTDSVDDPSQMENKEKPDAPDRNTAPDAPAVTVNDDGFRLRDQKTGKLFEVSARDYVRGSLAAEMPPTFHPEALKAQAVASHTYALYLKRRNREAGAETDKADFEVDPQNWKSYTTEKLFRERYGSLAESYWKTICEAADEVSGYIVTDEDAPIVAAYHSMSGGMTEDASNVWTGGKSYLMPVESRGDTLAPDYVTTETRSVQEVRDALRAAYPDAKLDGDPKTWLTVETRSAGGYVTELTAGGQPLAGTELRLLLGLRSANFETACDGAAFTFTVKGYGHGVGLSQYGADYMARQGATFDEILLHYYQGATLAMAAQG